MIVAGISSDFTLKVTLYFTIGARICDFTLIQRLGRVGIKHKDRLDVK